jgi:hypothetical protein
MERNFFAVWEGPFHMIRKEALAIAIEPVEEDGPEVTDFIEDNEDH